jgi:hypothetical protein
LTPLTTDAEALKVVAIGALQVVAVFALAPLVGKVAAEGSH